MAVTVTISPEDPSAAYSPTEAAVLAGCTPVWLGELCKRGEGPPSYKRHGRRFYPVDEFTAWLRERKQAQA